MGLLTRAWCGWRQVAWVALCRGDLRLGRVASVACVAPCLGDCWWACRVGGAVSLGLLTTAWSGRRRVLGIADTAFVWVAPCLGDCWWACRVGGAVSLGLLTTAWSGRRRVLGIADTAFVWVAPCLGGLLVGVSRGWRRVLGIADQGLVCVAPCLGGLLTRAS